ncbi:protein N-acetylglucosaminyltransferase [Aureococcus anophagefferens]|nr:protein N-acetylglucosaminyltransferase [Aureococcus anophagefferens]
MASPSAATPAAATRAEDAPPPGHRTPAAGPAHKPPGASPAASESPLRPGKENSTPGSDERSATLALAREKYNRRDFAGALACCQAAGCADDDAIDSLLLLGAVHFQLGRWEDCARHTLRCIKRAPGVAEVALDIEPNFPDACNNLGNALREHGDLEEAIACYRRALLLRPDHAHAHNNLGNAMKDKGLVNEAIQCYATAVGLAPRFAAAHSNLGLFADAYSNMGNAYKDLGRLDDAIRCYGEALKLRPDFADACSNLAAAYKDGGRHAEAVACYRRALELKPDFSDAFSNLAHSLVFVCDWSTRAADFERLTRIVRDQLAAAKPAVVDVDPAAPLKPGHRRFGGKVYPPEAGNVPSVQPFHTLVYPVSISDMRAIAERYADRAALQAAVLGLPEPLCDRLRPEDALRLLRETPDGARYGDAPAPGDGRLRLGYCSSDLGNHPLAHLMQSVFGMHDRSKFHVTCFALSGHDGSPWRRKIEAEVERFVDLSTASPRDCALAIRARAIDVLVNLNGYTKGARNEIFALRPAPIQVSYMGFCGTLGADYVQYVVADAVVLPRDHARHYSEKVCRVPHSYFVNDHAQSASYIFDAAALPKRADYGVPERASFVFCNFNQIYKIDPGILDVWCRILTRVDGSILWLLRFPPTGEANIRAEARKRGVSDDRIHFTAVSAKDEHIKRGVLADLFLDTPQCNAHTTGCDILWGGCPMVTCLGGKMATRVAASLLGAAGLADLVAPDLGGYEELAVALATDKERYAAVRRRAEACRAGPSRAPLWDTLRWVRNVERGYGAMWATHEAGAPPADIDVDDVGADGFDRTAYAPAALGPLPPLGCPRAAPQPPQRPPQPIQPPGLAALGPVGPHVAGVLFPPAPLFPPPFPAYGAQLRQPTYFLHQGNAVPPQRLPTPPAHYLQTPNAGFALYPPAALNQTDHRALRLRSR